MNVPTPHIALSTATPFSDRLREQRKHRGLSQLTLSLQADVSARHLSWLETGKSQPSRAMVLRLAEQLDLPLRERNVWLTTAGFAPLYRETPPSDAPLHALIQQLLDAHEPSPALAVDRHWNLVASNRLVPALLQQVVPALMTPPINVLRLSLHPQGLAPLIDNFAAWRDHVLSRLRRQMHTTGDASLAQLYDELCAMGDAPASDHGFVAQATANDVAVPLRLRSPWGPLNFITTITVFGAPHDVSLSELAIETLLPADTATAHALRSLHAELVARG
jgi:transcriptional regulator with XRE-family HTH domain